MAVLIASGTTPANSADIVLTDGSSTTLALVDGSSAGVVLNQDAYAEIQYKAASGAYYTFGRLDSKMPAAVLSGPGTFRVTRQLTAEAFGVDQN